MLVWWTVPTVRPAVRRLVDQELVDQSFVLQRVLVFSPSFWLSDSIPTLSWFLDLEPIFYLSFGKFLEFYFRNGSIFFTVITTSPKTSLVSRIYFGNSLSIYFIIYCFSIGTYLKSYGYLSLLSFTEFLKIENMLSESQD